MEAVPGGGAGAVTGLGGEKELVSMFGEPGGESQLGIPVGGGGIDVVDAELEEHRQQLVGSLLAHAAERGGAEDDPAAGVSSPSELGPIDHGPTLPIRHGTRSSDRQLRWLG